MSRTLEQIRQDQFLKTWREAQKLLEPRELVEKEIRPKTPYMKLIELQKGQRLEDLLEEGTVEEMAEELGVPRSTVGSWRLRLGMRLRSRQSDRGTTEV